MTDAREADGDEASLGPAEGSSSSSPGRTAFDALNPYGDFGGPDPSGARLLVVVLCCLVAFAGLFGAGGLWMKHALASEEQDDERVPAVSASAPAGANEQPSPAMADAIPPAEVEKVEEIKAVEAVEAVEVEQVEKVEKAAPDRRRAARRQPAPTRPARALILSGVSDRSRTDLDGLDEALERGFLARVAALAPDVAIENGGEPRAEDVAVKVVLTGLQEGSGGGAHDVTAQCALGAKPRTALPSGPLRSQGKSQGIEASPALREQAVERCGARLADALGPVLQSLK